MIEGATNNREPQKASNKTCIDKKAQVSTVENQNNEAFIIGRTDSIPPTTTSFDPTASEAQGLDEGRTSATTGRLEGTGRGGEGCGEVSPTTPPPVFIKSENPPPVLCNSDEAINNPQPNSNAVNGLGTLSTTYTPLDKKVGDAKRC
jgi:hypothetical protein